MFVEVFSAHFACSIGERIDLSPPLTSKFNYFFMHYPSTKTILKNMKKVQYVAYVKY